MRYSWLAVACLAVPASLGCSGAPSEGASRGSALAATGAAPASIAFTSDWREVVSGEPTGGGTLDVTYDASRLPSCRGDLDGRPGWSITAFARVNGVDAGSFAVAGLTNGPTPPSFVVPFAGDLEMWFQATDAWGCSAYDSRYGANYHFNVVAPANAPGWIGNAGSIVDRAECGGAPCWADAKPIDGAVFDTWARTRAAFALAYFEVWKAGVTDFANPDLWKELDVELHGRVGSSGPFQTSYVSFRDYVGHHARYAVDLRAIDPLPAGSALTDASQCPPIAATKSAEGQYVDADYEYYVTVNGVALQPAGGGVFHAKFENYAGLYAVCAFAK